MNRRELMGFMGVTAVSTQVLRLHEAARATERSLADGFDVQEKSLAALALAMDTGAVTSAALTVAYLDRITRYDQSGPTLSAVLSLNPDAIQAARGLDAERRAGKVRSALHGIPLLIKDNIETLDNLSTTAGSLALANARHTTDAPLVARLRAAGAVILGKSNLSEWANARGAASTEGWSGVGGQTRNAYDPTRQPEGSSSGSAVGTATSLCAAAIGTETDGSVIAPASLNGLVGLKPTAGLVSNRGLVPVSPRQDTAGPLAREVADALALMDIIAEKPLGTDGAGIESFRLRNLRIGVLPASQDSHSKVVAQYADWCALLRSEGALVKEVATPKGATSLWDHEKVTLSYELKASLNQYLATLDPRQVACRTLEDLIAFNNAHAAEEMPHFGQEGFEAANRCGSLDTPAYQSSLARLQHSAGPDCLEKLLGASELDVLAAPANGPAGVIDYVWGDRIPGWPLIASAAAIVGYPSIAIPAGFIAGLPVGIVFVARRYKDGLLLRIGRAFERARAARVPPRLA